MRWDAANDYGGPLPFNILHISEFLAEQVVAGKLNLSAIGKSATFHDPCQVSRRGGAIEAPRVVLAALGVDLKECSPRKAPIGVAAVAAAWWQSLTPTNCGIRYFASRWRRSKIPAPNCPSQVVPAAAAPSMTGKRISIGTRSMNSLVELVADNLAEVPA